MPRYCAAIGCTNSATKLECKRKAVSFHQFPLQDKKLMQRWIINMKRDFQKGQPNSHTVLCSEHFEETEFIYQSFTNRRGLRKGAVPTIFSFKDTIKRKRTSYKFGASAEATTSEPLSSNTEEGFADASCQTDLNLYDILWKKNAELEKEIAALEEKNEKAELTVDNESNKLSTETLLMKIALLEKENLALRNALQDKDKVLSSVLSKEPHISILQKSKVTNCLLRLC